MELESVVNVMVKEKKIKVYHGLVLRNAIEEMESNFAMNVSKKYLEEE